jgi:nucleoside-diphosphate-sugar epimerase
MRTIAITGASGFIGRSLVAEWRSKADLRPIVRGTADEAGFLTVGDIGPQTDWHTALDGVDTIVHCAGRAHVLQESEADPLALYRLVNRDGTLHLARSAAKAGVRRIVFLSSVGVMGEQKPEASPFSAFDIPAPIQDYALSKWEAEQGLLALSQQLGLEAVVVRPPLVYGPGAPANFQRLLRVVDRGMPLPLGLVRAKRSFVGISNLSDMLWACVESPDAKSGTFMVSDGEDLSTADLIRCIARHMGKRPLLLPVPLWALRLGGRLLGRTADVERLLSPLRVAMDHTHDTLGWSPRTSVDREIENCVAAFAGGRG